MESPLSSKTKYIMKPHHRKESIKPQNIFNNQTVEDQATFGNMTMYSIVGDKDFKQQFYKQKTMGSWREEQTPINTTHNLNKTSKIDNALIFNKQDKYKKLQSNNEKRIMEKVKQLNEQSARINWYLMKRSGKSQSKTITYGSIKQIYSHPNPSKDDLINDNIPEFWKNSLRDNEKRLKRHVRGNPFKKEHAEEMLQTLRGRSMLQKSIPKIKQQFVEPTCSKKVSFAVRKKGFSLTGAKIKVNLLEMENHEKIKANQQLHPEFEQIHKYQYDVKHKWRLHELNL